MNLNSYFLALSALTLQTTAVQAQGYKFITTLQTTPLEIAQKDTCKYRCPEIHAYFVETDYPALDKAINSDTLNFINSYNQDSIEDIKVEIDAVKVDDFLSKIYQSLKKQEADFDVPGINMYSTILVQPAFTGTFNDLFMYESSQYSFILGAAHPYTGIKQFVYDTKNNKLLTAKDLVKEGMFEKFQKLAHAEFIKQSTANKVDKNIAKEADFFVSDNFTFNTDGIIFTYNPYEILGYALGKQTVYIGYEELKDLFKPEYLPK
ncbi:RsiV family protein [Taylorella equigenitalis]|uniref:RsiV family protein n=1 Tax=Taylorella equigenitalis TaxID=29575 RepID=UPI0004103172|nr:RsiV family protein [Taylorella equigenitalis]ASY37124.1 DUF3298 domain-containing protein [Taylorella equigenitalis]KGK33611.1 hypothetical protein LW90_03180 [Taylorella equigenitalis]WDU46414.1 RsiV family protein [Taylorella equigenitalis]